MAKVYKKEEVMCFKQTPGKIYCLNPAIERHLPSGHNRRLLDVGCGDGFYYDMCVKKGYVYQGVDISEEMIKKAQINFPQGEFILRSCLELTNLFNKDAFDIVVSSMVFPEFDNLDIFKKALSEIYYVMKNGSTFLLGTSHPAYDMYMRKYLLNLDYVDTEFIGYFDSGKSFSVKGITTGVVYRDQHWTLENYINELINAGFEITTIDECKIIDMAKTEIDSYIERLKLPSYILFVVKKEAAKG